MTMDRQIQFFRDGASQRNRLLRALEPDYVAVDERSLSDLLKFTQEYAKELKYYDELNSLQGNWEPFFAGDIHKMIAYIKNPENFADDELTLKKFSQPHLVLFFTFLQLLRYPQQQFKELTPRHIDFYYQEVLRFTKKEEVPDRVHVAFSLAKGEKVYLLKQNTLLDAGKDNQGFDLKYAIDEDIILNQAQVASVKTLSVSQTHTKTNNIYANSIVTVEEGQEASSPRFGTFKTTSQTLGAEVGFAIASPLLLLKEGTRQITLTLACKENTLDRDLLNETIGKGEQPFDIYLSSEKQWIEIESSTLEIGDFILEEALKIYQPNQLSLNDNSLICTAAADEFDRRDLNKYLIFGDGNVYQITQCLSKREVQLSFVDRVQLSPGDNQIKKYATSPIYSNSLRLRLSIEDILPAIEPSKANESTVAIDTPYPVVKILLKNVEQKNDAQPEEAAERIIDYDRFKSIRLEKVHIQVDVRNMRELQLRNDSSVLNYQSPFQPFGYRPKVGSCFYIANPEICRKKLANLAIHIEWMGLPEDFANHYQAYARTGIIRNAIANHSFKTRLKLLNNRNWYSIEDSKPIFTKDNNTLSNPIQLSYQDFDLPDYILDISPLETDTNDPFEQIRYFKLELESPDFAHDSYPLVLNKVALATDSATRSLTVYPPYTPEIKAISLDYTASVEIDLSAAPAEHPTSQIFQIHPFGYVKICHPQEEDPLDCRSYLLPQYNEVGALFIGIRNLQPPQDLSLLFQLMPGSANVELTKPEIYWSYLSGDRWQDFQDTQILSDTTNGLVDAGIIRLSIPEEATARNQMFADDLYWLRAIVKENAAAIPDTLDIKTQAVSATFVNQGNAAEHLSKPLAADSIQALVIRDSAIEKVIQPYTSFQGKRKEDRRSFNTRVSERLRHKQRALTPWDYERLVLERFPEIYKVKCITSALGFNTPSEAKVTVVVVPDIANTAPFFPLEPKAPLSLLKKIEAYLKAQTSPFVNLVVKNPRYERIKYRFSIRFRQRSEQGYYLKKLNEDIKRFLSPWTHEGQVNITFGSSIHSSVVINFIKKRPYVDYVANLKLIEQIDMEEDSQGTSTIKFRVSESNLAQVRSPDSVLVSATDHTIDVITP